MVLNKELNTDGRLPSDGTQDEPMLNSFSLILLTERSTYTFQGFGNGTTEAHPEGNRRIGQGDIDRTEEGELYKKIKKIVM